jgi:hypothetical protein
MAMMLHYRVGMEIRYAAYKAAPRLALPLLA